MEQVCNRKLLIVDDDRAFLKKTAEFFRVQENEVLTAETLADAVETVRREKDLDAIVLEALLPDGCGLDLMERFEILPPVIVLSVLGTEENILSGFDAGAADYVVKPCSLKLLETRLSLRLLPKGKADLAFGDFSIDSAARVARFGGQPIALTSSEFNILYFLASHADEFFSAGEIYERVWDAPALRTTTIKRHLSTLRHKLNDAAPGEPRIVTEFGKGYCFIDRRRP